MAGASDDADLRRLLRESPMRGAVSLAFACEPSFFDAQAIEGDRHATLVAEGAAGRIVAMGSRSVRAVYVNGRVARMGYLGRLRIDPSWRRRVRVLREGFATARGFERAADEMPFDLTSIVEDNAPARRVLEAGLRGLPSYHAFVTFVTLVMPVGGRGRLRGPMRFRVGGRRPIEIEAGRRVSIHEILACLERNNRRFQFAPVWTAGALRSARRTPDLAPGDFLVARVGGRVVGCLARWDQRRFKQTVVHDYAPSLRRWRPVVNALAPVLRTAPLPRPGATIGCELLSHVAIDDDDPGVAEALIAAARAGARQRGITSQVIGFATRHPLLGPVRRRVPHRAYRSRLYLVDWRGGGTTSRVALDDRPVHVEVALL